MPGHFWNVDETGLQDYFVPMKVIGESGKPCYQMTACERGETTTVVAAFNALGTFVSPMIIFKGKRLKPEWVDAVPKDIEIVIRMSDNGWITGDLFLVWARAAVLNLIFCCTPSKKTTRWRTPTRKPVRKGFLVLVK